MICRSRQRLIHFQLQATTYHDIINTHVFQFPETSQDYEIQIKDVACEKVFPSEYLEFSITATILKNLLKRIVNESTSERKKETPK